MNTHAIYSAPCPGYSQVFGYAICFTRKLRQPAVLAEYLQRGFRWIRQKPQDYNRILRNPTDGCLVELSVMKMPWMVPIHSARGREMIRKVRYF